jgi:hypothetical protein
LPGNGGRDIGASVTNLFSTYSAGSVSLEVCENLQGLAKLLQSRGTVTEGDIKGALERSKYDWLVEQDFRSLVTKLPGELTELEQEAKASLLEKIQLEKQNVASNCIIWATLTAIPIIYNESNALSEAWVKLNSAQAVVQEDGERLAGIRAGLDSIETHRHRLLDLLTDYVDCHPADSARRNDILQQIRDRTSFINGRVVRARRSIGM